MNSNGNWQSIQTAPMDGTRILVYAPYFGYDLEDDGCNCRHGILIAGYETDCMFGLYRDNQGKLQNVSAWVVFTDNGAAGEYGGSDYYTKPTHWMPLPTPPNEANDDA